MAAIATQARQILQCLGAGAPFFDDSDLIARSPREHKEDLGALVSIEVGKIVFEGLGEVEEMQMLAGCAEALVCAVKP